MSETQELFDIGNGLAVRRYARRRSQMSEEHTIEPMLQFFEYAHLRDDLQIISAPFCTLAIAMVNLLPRNPERTAALRKLLEAKDWAVRAGTDGRDAAVQSAWPHIWSPRRPGCGRDR